MHGADSDVLWLQRDFGLYVVALFDTGQAARVLQFSSYSLAYLLERYAGVAANKKFALADWRIRPLGDEMIRCAVPPPPRTTRTHTHPRPPRRNQPCYIHARHPTPLGDTISRILRRPRRARPTPHDSTTLDIRPPTLLAAARPVCTCTPAKTRTTCFSFTTS